MLCQKQMLVITVIGIFILTVSMSLKTKKENLAAAVALVGQSYLSGVENFESSLREYPEFFFDSTQVVRVTKYADLVSQFIRSWNSIIMPLVQSSSGITQLSGKNCLTHSLQFYLTLRIKSEGKTGSGSFYEGTHRHDSSKEYSQKTSGIIGKACRVEQKKTGGRILTLFL